METSSRVQPGQDEEAKPVAGRGLREKKVAQGEKRRSVEEDEESARER